MIQRKLLFASPFIVIAACGGGQTVPPHENPPAPIRRSPDDCAKIEAGTACMQDHDGACSVPNDTGCGIIGWDCIDEGETVTWKPQVVLCNPPPPSSP